jgi:hypothetical protein
MKRRKVFGIGFHKTGTTTLAIALRRLGYRVTGPNGTNDPEIEKNVYSMAYALVEQFDAFQDNPWPILYRELDARFPGSKFILTTRSSASWIRSQIAHFGVKETPMRRWIYGKGCPEGNEDIYLKRFDRHNKEVVAYFRGREEQFLSMDFTVGDGWEKLCAFLGFEPPAEPFPHANKTSDHNLVSGCA